jgi:hypothetical protein
MRGLIHGQNTCDLRDLGEIFTAIVINITECETSVIFSRVLCSTVCRSSLMQYPLLGEAGDYLLSGRLPMVLSFASIQTKSKYQLLNHKLMAVNGVEVFAPVPVTVQTTAGKTAERHCLLYDIIFAVCEGGSVHCVSRLPCV